MSARADRSHLAARAVAKQDRGIVEVDRGADMHRHQREEITPLGPGDILLRHDAVAPHVANPMFAQALITHARGTDATAADARLEKRAFSTAGVQVLDRAALRSAEAEDTETNAWVNYLVLGVLMAFCAVAVVNTLAMATAERSRELALLRLVGATPKQVTRMIRWEALAVTGFGLALGTAVAAATLGLAASELSARAALRHNPAEAIAAAI